MLPINCSASWTNLLASFNVAFVFFVIQKEASILVEKQHGLPGLIIDIIMEAPYMQHFDFSNRARYRTFLSGPHSFGIVCSSVKAHIKMV